MAKDIDHELRTLRRLPYGVARTSATEALVRRLETDGPERQLPQALLDLVEAYTFANLGKQGFVAFARTLRLWDSRPELFDEADERNLFWEFKWIAGDLPDYPEITAEQADAFLADMTRRFAIAGKGGSSVRMSRFRWAWHTGSADMERARIDWITGDRDELEDCATCTVGQQTDYFTELGRYEEAVAIGKTSTGTCNLEPTRTMHALALAALRTGDAELATRSYRRAVATYSSAEGSDFAPAHGQAFELLAIGGALDRALQQLRTDTGRLLLEASTPLFRLRFLLGVLSGLSANLDRSGLPTASALPRRRPSASSTRGSGPKPRRSRRSSTAATAPGTTRTRSPGRSPADARSTSCCSAASAIPYPRRTAMARATRRRAARRAAAPTTPVTPLGRRRSLRRPMPARNPRTPTKPTLAPSPRPECAPT